MQAFVPLKSHSERVPGKNFRNLANRPLFAWIIDTLLCVEEISIINIDTDSENRDLWALAKNPKIRIKKRAAHLLGDFISMNEIIHDFVSTSEVEGVMMTHVTNPFLQAPTIKSAIQTYQENYNFYDSLFSVSPIQGRLYNEKGIAINHNPQELLRTQDLEKIYLENSCLYLFDKTSFLKNRNRIGSTPLLFPISALEAIDIDTQEEWELAEKLALTF
jgi:CMP-N-acetylneuraminic acid synthetase